MGNKIVDLTGRRRHDAPPVSDFWFAQVDVRLGRIEQMLSRLAWQIFLIVGTSAGLLIFEIIKALSGDTT